jgi:hypothetical protein
MNLTFLWNECPSLDHIINAVSAHQQISSFAGTSLRLKDCQEMVRNCVYMIHQPEHIRNQTRLLWETFDAVMSSRECLQLAGEIVNRILEDYNARTVEKTLERFL